MRPKRCLLIGVMTAFSTRIRLNLHMTKGSISDDITSMLCNQLPTTVSSSLSAGIHFDKTNTCVADEIVRDDETFNDKDQPINYRPAKPKPERDRQQSMESLYNEEDEGLDLNHEDEGVHHNKYEDDEAQEGDDEFQRLLEKNEQDLQQAMKRLHKLHKKRSNITKAHLARKKIK
ncbi:hypothetical protein F5H01DRAFT_381777 [Linnemannia elongata]|nr:hypothetical protein F5H01DRAFT_381777 [Linnemannia elongata]